MLHKMENERIKNWGSNYHEDPKDNIWSKIEQKLDASKPKESKIFKLGWKHYAIAANVLLVIAVIAGFSDYFNNHSNSMFSYNINQKPLKMEELKYEDNSAGFYSVENIVTLSNAYKSKGF